MCYDISQQTCRKYGPGAFAPGEKPGRRTEWTWQKAAERTAPPDRERAGFTLAELLIVVAIIAVLAAIAIPIFSAQLEKSREAVDLDNVRAAYSAVMYAAMTEDRFAYYNDEPIVWGRNIYQVTVSPLTQQADGWTTPIDGVDLGGVTSEHWKGTPLGGGACRVSYNTETGEATINWYAGSGGGYYNPDRDPLTHEMKVNAATTFGGGYGTGTDIKDFKYSAFYNTTTGEFAHIGLVIEGDHDFTLGQAGYVYRSTETGDFFQTDGTYWYKWNDSSSTWEQQENPYLYLLEQP